MDRRCPECPWTGATGREVADHRRTRHGAQQVVCPYCPCYNLHQTPSSLKRHIRNQHPVHDDGLLGTGIMYYFAVHSAAYRSIARDIPNVESEIALQAQATLRRWSDIAGSTESKRVVAQAERDWAKQEQPRDRNVFPDLGADLLPEDLSEAVALLQGEALQIGDIPLPPSPGPAASLSSVPPIIPPAPRLQEVPQAPLAPRPQELTALGKLPSLGPSAMELLETGSWPALCAGRRDWSKGQVMLEIPAMRIQWPPSNWEEMSREQKRAAWQALATLYTWMDEPDGRFPISGPGRLMDDYSFLALPGSGNGPEPKTSVDKALGQLRASNHKALKQVAGKGAPLEPELTSSLQASRHAGPARRRAVLRQVAEAKVPLRPLWKAPPAAPPVKPPSTVPAYSPTMPEM